MRRKKLHGVVPSDTLSPRAVDFYPGQLNRENRRALKHITHDAGKLALLFQYLARVYADVEISKDKTECSLLATESEIEKCEHFSSVRTVDAHFRKSKVFDWINHWKQVYSFPLQLTCQTRSSISPPPLIIVYSYQGQCKGEARQLIQNCGATRRIGRHGPPKSVASASGTCDSSVDQS